MPPLSIIPFEGVPGGMCVAKAAHEIPETMARYLQDTLLDQQGYPKRRGPVQAAAGVVTFTNNISSLVQARDPAGVTHIGALEDNAGTAQLSVLSSDYLTKTSITWSGSLPVTPYYLVDNKPALKGGSIIGTSHQASLTDSQAVGYWKGADKANYTLGAPTVTRGSTAVTGTNFTGNVVSGMFLFDTNGYLVGCVKSVDSNIALTLEEAALVATAGVGTFKSVRGINPKVVKGRVTTTVAAATVTGENTKFSDQGLGTGTWDLYRARDLTWVGQVTSVTNNTSLTLLANAAVAMDKERYVAVQRNGDYGVSTLSATSRKVGFLNATFAGRQWYANLSSGEKVGWVWFSDDSDPEAVDLSPVDGDFIPIGDGSPQSTAQPITGLAPAYNSLVVFKENAAYAIFGSTPDDFEARKIHDDGCLSSMSIQTWEGGIIFAGRQGIYYYDGMKVENVVKDSLGLYYSQSIATIDPSTYRMWSMMDRDHYFLFVERVTPTVAVIKGATSTTPTRMTFILNLQTGAVTTATNLDIRGSTTLPIATGKGTWYAVNTSTGGRICALNDLFDQEAADVLTCTGNTAGPDWYMESKKYDFGDPLIKKLVKMILLHFLVAGGSIKLDTVLGLNTAGTTSTTMFGGTIPTWDTLGTVYSAWDSLGAASPTWDQLVADGVWSIKRIKFVKRSQFFQYRLYQSASTITSLRVGPVGLGYKLLRPGRI